MSADQIISELREECAELDRRAIDGEVDQLRDVISDLIKRRIDKATSAFVVANEGKLLSALASLQFLCTDLREERKAA